LTVEELTGGRKGDASGMWHVQASAESRPARRGAAGAWIVSQDHLKGMQVMKTTQDIINDSGYPLQLHLESQIEATRNRHKWQVLAREHRWVNSESLDEGFIDLVLESTSAFVKLVVECKRVSGSWTFLLPDMNPSDTSKTRILHTDSKLHQLTWEERNIEPRSYHSAFCVMEVDGKKDSRTLEKLSGEVLLSLEYLALEDRKLHQVRLSTSKQVDPYEPELFYLPIVVTTAKLQTCIFDPNSVSINDGKIPSTSRIEEIKFIRFRKNLATTTDKRWFTEPEVYDLSASNQENDRTVFVVQAKHFVDFLILIGK
jgi:hypothetical protein